MRKLLRPIHAVAYTEVGVGFCIENRGFDGHQLLCAIKVRERPVQFLGKLDSLLHEVCIVVTIEHKAVGVVIIQEQYQLETVGASA